MIKGQTLRWAVVATAAALAAGHEGLRRRAYLDPIGIPTICFGSTKGVKLGDVKTLEECKRLLNVEMEQHLRGIEPCIKPVLSPEEYTAYASFAYNVGVGAFCGSTLRKKLDRGDRAGACAELSKWVYAGGKMFPGLVKRRAEERQLCESGLAS